MKSILTTLYLLFNTYTYTYALNNQNCNKLWQMNNEISNKNIYSIAIYMCVDDPYGIYENIMHNSPTPSPILSPSPSSILHDLIPSTFNNISNHTLNYTLNNITNFTTYNHTNNITEIHSHNHTNTNNFTNFTNFTNNTYNNTNHTTIHKHYYNNTNNTNSTYIFNNITYHNITNITNTSIIIKHKNNTKISNTTSPINNTLNVSKLINIINDNQVLNNQTNNPETNNKPDNTSKQQNYILPIVLSSVISLLGIIIILFMVYINKKNKINSNIDDDVENNSHPKRDSKILSLNHSNLSPKSNAVLAKKAQDETWYRKTFSTELKQLKNDEQQYKIIQQRVNKDIQSARERFNKENNIKTIPQKKITIGAKKQFKPTKIPNDTINPTQQISQSLASATVISKPTNHVDNLISNPPKIITWEEKQRIQQNNGNNNTQNTNTIVKKNTDTGDIL